MFYDSIDCDGKYDCIRIEVNETKREERVKDAPLGCPAQLQRNAG